jgi:hypothetical protein
MSRIVDKLSIIKVIMGNARKHNNYENHRSL